MTWKNTSTSSALNNSTGCYDDVTFKSLQSIILILKVVAFIAIYAISTIGNMIIGYVIIRTHRLWTFTNIMMLNYSFVTLLFLLSGLLQFISDTVYHGEWPFGQFLCKTAFSSFILTIIASAFSITFMCYARYKVICMPLNIQPNPRQALYCIIFTWVIAIGYMLPYAMVLSDRIILNKSYCLIDISWQHGIKRPIYDFSLFIITYFIPMITAIYYNLQVIRGLKLSTDHSANGRHNPSGTNYRLRDENIDLAKEKLRHMSIFIFAAYLIAWLPFWIFVLLINTKVVDTIISKVLRYDCHIQTKFLIIRTFTKYIAYFYSAFNVFICYNYNPHFNAAFKSIFCYKQCISDSYYSNEKDQRRYSLYKCSSRSDTRIYDLTGPKLTDYSKRDSRTSLALQITPV